MKEHPLCDLDLTLADEETNHVWAQSEQLSDTQILSIVLCRFTAERLTRDLICQARLYGKHPETECATRFYSVDGLRADLIEQATVYDASAQRAPWRGGEATNR